MHTENQCHLTIICYSVAFNDGCKTQSLKDAAERKNRSFKITSPGFTIKNYTICMHEFLDKSLASI